MSVNFESFKEKANKLHENKYDYSKFEYVNGKTTSVIVCPYHGEFTQRADSHVKDGSVSCPACARELRFEAFKLKANEQHNSKYDYSKFKYTTQKTASTIICPVHGEFSQKPDHHTRKDSHGCPSCWEELKSDIARANYKPDKFTRTMPKEVFYAKAQRKFGPKFTYDLSTYTDFTGNEIAITCPIHGEFHQNPARFLQTNYGCNACALIGRADSMTHSYDEVLAQLTTVYGDKYSYPEGNRANYTNKKTWIQVVCPEHGMFLKKVQNLLSGQGCFECTVERMITDGVLVGGYSERLFKERPELKDVAAYLYYFFIGDYYKIGVTRRPVKQRATQLKSLSGRDVEVLFSKKMTLFEAYTKEQELLKQFEAYRIRTKYSTEFFKVDITKLDGFKL